MADDDNLLFVRGSDDLCDADDVWDDSALIKAYDKAISLAKEEVSKRIGVEHQKTDVKPKKPQCQKQSRQTQKLQKKWFIGSPCRAIYSEDGELYEAVVTKLFENTGFGIVKFIGYNNTEKVELASLIESEGLQSQIAQQKEAATVEQYPMECEEPTKLNGSSEDHMDCGTSETKPKEKMYRPEALFGSDSSTMPPAPPLPPQLMARLPENDADALSSMLMSWYMSGFHTGYYHGLKQAHSRREQREK